MVLYSYRVPHLEVLWDITESRFEILHLLNCSEFMHILNATATYSLGAHTLSAVSLSRLGLLPFMEW